MWGGSYHDYWFTDDAVLKVRLVPQIITVVGILVLLVLTFVLGIVGVLIGAAIAAATYFASGRLARSRRAGISLLSPQQVREKGLVILRIPYSVISRAEISGRRLTIFVEGRRIRVNVPDEELPGLQSMLRSKLSDGLSVLDG